MMSISGANKGAVPNNYMPDGGNPNKLLSYLDNIRQTPRCRFDSLDALPQGAVIGTASVRRQAQLLHARPDLAAVMIRGNVQTRLDKVSQRLCDASLLALAEADAAAKGLSRDPVYAVERAVVVVTGARS